MGGRVDLLLIAGDLFDHNRVSDETVEFARRELDRLRSAVVILPGNHDYAGAPALERQDGECAVLRIGFSPTAASA